MLKVKNLNVFTTINNDKKYLLNDIYFQLDKGDSLGIYGKTGSGKSTLAKALLNIYENNVCLESGEILIDNIPFSNSFRGKKISLLFQNPNTYLNPLIKVGKQIEEMLTYHYNYDKKSAKVKVIEMMRKVGIKDAINIYNYFPSQISGGMQQKICLCICLICNPKILILDESTSFLDKESKNEILNLIKNIQKENNLTLIIISHDLKELYNTCNKLAIIRDGSMIEFGNIDELILSPNHPFTIELLIDYLSYYEDVEKFSCPLMKIEKLYPAPPIYLSPTHYSRNWYLNSKSLKISSPKNIKKIKEKVYENLRS